MAEIRFASREHNEFFITMLQKAGNSDNFHQAFFYCVGISSTTRKNVNRLYDFDKDRIKSLSCGIRNIAGIYPQTGR